MIVTRRWLVCVALTACDPFGATTLEAPRDAGGGAAVGVDAGDAGAGGGADGGPTPDAGPEDAGPKKRIFVSAGGKDGDLLFQAKVVDSSFTCNGVEAGDLLCQTEAKLGGLTGTFRAWLSISGVDAISRFTDTGPRYSVLGVKILPKVGAAPLSAVPNVQGVPLGAGRLVWTGTGANGRIVNEGTICGGWREAVPTVRGIVGDPTATDDRWTHTQESACSPTSAHLYCIEE